MPAKPPHLIHLPVEPRDLLARKVIQGKAIYQARCRIPAKMPPRVKVWVDPETGRLQIIAGPHPRYYAYCRRCADTLSEVDRATLQNIEGNDWKGDPVSPSA